MASVTLSPTGASGSGWNFASRLTAEDGSGAEYNLSSSSLSNVLTVTFPSAGLASTDVIDGIEVRLVGKRASNGVAVAAHNITFPNGAAWPSASDWSGPSYTSATVGSPTSLWGATWNASVDFTSAWNLTFQIRKSGSGSAVGYVDFAEVTIYYHAGATEVTADRALSWDVRTPITADRALSWAVRSPVTADRSLSWAVRSPITADRDLSWAVRSAITTDRALSWHVRQATATDRSLSWAVAEAVAADRVLLWDVEPAVGVVVVDRDVGWSVLVTVSADRALSWDIREITTADAVLLWDVRALVDVDRDLAWAIREAVEADRELVWRVRTNAIIRQIIVHGSARAAQSFVGAPHEVTVVGSGRVVPSANGSPHEGIITNGSARQPVIVKGSAT